jgi:flagellin
MQVYNNIPAFSVWKNYTANVTDLRKSMSKLSSGLRITNAGDDPAGLAMSERLRTQYRNSAAAANNVENKINYLQTADSWLQKVHDILGRMAELSVMANDGTKSQIDRNNLQNEFEQMQKEVQRITSGATAAGKFNGLYLFRGGNGVATMTGDGVETGFGSVRLQVGPDSNMVFNEDPINLSCANFDTIGSYNTYSYGSVNMTLLGSNISTVKWASLICCEHLSIATQSVAQGAVDKLNIGIDYISSIRSTLGAEMNRMEQTLSGLRNYEENIRSTESRIRDVDVAYETTLFAKYQILTQIGTSMLAQANSLPGSVMQLIGG